jgi:hypothetical protein
MFSYAVALKPVVLAGGIENLDETKKALFKALLEMTSHFFKATPEIDDVEIRDDFTLVLKSSVDVWDIISGRLGESAIVSRL